MNESEVGWLDIEDNSYLGEPYGFDPAIGKPYYRKTLRWRLARFWKWLKH